MIYLCTISNRWWYSSLRDSNRKLSDPFDIAEDEDEQKPEEYSDDSGPDENHDLHVGPVVWSSTHKKDKTGRQPRALKHIKDSYMLTLKPIFCDL